MKLLKKNIQLNLHDLGLRTFLYMTPKIQATKEKLNKSGFFQIKNISASKDTMKESEKTADKLEKNFANRVSNNRIIPEMYKEF